MAEWAPNTVCPTDAWCDPQMAEFFVHRMAQGETPSSAPVYAHPFRMRIRPRWSAETGDAVRLASLDSTGLGNLPRGVLSGGRGAVRGAWLSPARDVAPGVAMPVAIFPAMPMSNVGVDLEFEIPQMLLVPSPQGMVTFTLVVF